MVNFGKSLKTWSLRSNSVTRQVNFNRAKIDGKCQNSKLQIRHFEWFCGFWGTNSWNWMGWKSKRRAEKTFFSLIEDLLMSDGSCQSHFVAVRCAIKCVNFLLWFRCQILRLQFSNFGPRPMSTLNIDWRTNSNWCVRWRRCRKRQQFSSISVNLKIDDETMI